MERWILSSGVDFINDSRPPMDAHPGPLHNTLQPVILIAGGRDKNAIIRQ